MIEIVFVWELCGKLVVRMNNIDWKYFPNPFSLRSSKKPNSFSSLSWFFPFPWLTSSLKTKSPWMSFFSPLMSFIS
ncbi:hypothetical protein Lalb_Chr01g0006141 [Lupinus albus]|uniref:Uncharacterized protein n=1 Tax=Lupinus albus TaxID=3870 RepID=A0A6A4R3S0_LUPAL|nr:hypothetical protein Lalb_Chr01g0006141 [Lupinus albus]